MNKLIRTLGLLAGLLWAGPLWAQTAVLLPNAMTQFTDANGVPLANGVVYFYVPFTTTPKNTWKDPFQTTLNANPITLDGAGRALIWGSGEYRQVLQDQYGSTVWDQLTYGAVPSSGLTGPITVTGSLTVTGDILATGTGELQLPSGTTGQRTGSPVAGMVRYNSSFGYYEAYNGAAAGWTPLTPEITPGGRMTLTSGSPTLGSTGVIAATSVYYDPYLSGMVPVWTGGYWTPYQFNELTMLLSDATQSPTAAVANACYDAFVWSNGAGSLVFSRGPTWVTQTSRGYTLNRVQGMLTNPTNIPNGPLAGYGLYVGTLCTDSTGGTVTYNPLPAPTSGGPTGGAWIGFWNYYNRIYQIGQIQDSKTSWTYAGVPWRASDNSNNNRITVVAGFQDDGVVVEFNDQMVVSSNEGNLSIGLNSTTTASVYANNSGFYLASVVGGANVTSGYENVNQLGLNYYQALESASGGSSVTFAGSNQHQLTLTSKY